MSEGRRRTTGIFGGSFNPVHNGHIALCEALVERGIVDSVWLTLSPLNPIKEHPEELIADSSRLDMLRIATEGRKGLEVCDIELTMPRPSYTINTLQTLARLYPESDFRLIIGSDNMLVFDRWKDHELIIERFRPIVYPRPGYPCAEAIEGLPEFAVSSTEIRRMVSEGCDVNSLLPPGVTEYIKANNLYS